MSDEGFEEEDIASELEQFDDDSTIALPMDLEIDEVHFRSLKENYSH